MSTALRPNVNVTETIQQLVTPGANALTIGIIGVSEQGNTTDFLEFFATTDIENEYGTNFTLFRNLVPLAKAALNEGATKVKLLSIGTPVSLGLPGTGAEVPSVAIVAGDTTITMLDTSDYTAGDTIVVGFQNAGFQFEEQFDNIAVTSGVLLTLDTGDAFQFDHQVTEIVQEITLPVIGDFTAAQAILALDRDIMAVVLDTTTDAIFTALQTTITTAIANENFMFAVRAYDRKVANATARTNATTLDDEDFIAAWPTLLDANGKYIQGQFTAAGVAGAISGRGLPNVNYNLLELISFGGVVEALTDIDLDIGAGLTPIELRDGVIRVVRLLTTAVTFAGGESDLLEEASVRINVNHIKRTVQRGLESRFLTVGNTAKTRESIRSYILGIGQSFNQDGILTTDERTGTPGYKDPIIETDATDAKQVNIEWEIAPTQPLVFIDLTFAVNL